MCRWLYFCSLANVQLRTRQWQSYLRRYVHRRVLTHRIKWRGHSCSGKGRAWTCTVWQYMGREITFGCSLWGRRLRGCSPPLLVPWWSRYPQAWSSLKRVHYRCLIHCPPTVTARATPCGYFSWVISRLGCCLTLPLISSGHQSCSLSGEYVYECSLHCFVRSISEVALGPQIWQMDRLTFCWYLGLIVMRRFYNNCFLSNSIVDPIIWYLMRWIIINFSLITSL